MKLHSAVLTFLVGVASALGAGGASADFINGDFETGDLTGWTASAIDRNGDPTTPLISVAAVGGNHFAVFKTGPFDAGPFVSTLSQSFTVSAAEPFLLFDFTRPLVVPDPTGTGTSPFHDAFIVSLSDGTDTFTLLLADQTGVSPDPFGTAPGPVALGVPSDPTFDLAFGVDLSALAGQVLTLYFDVTDEDDGLRFDPFLDNVGTSATGLKKIPEPGGFALLCLGALGVFGYRWQRQRRAA